jgi:DMSO/TMAO reductase YedYZ heme-binding membrane subunit/nitrite reductase/ring-hydroxylating ferredoxin subunit
MAHRYKAIGWNGAKIVYDLVVVGAVLAFLATFLFVGSRPLTNGHTAEPVVLLIRGLGLCAFLLLTAILMIGPLARLSPRAKPALYNRRHLGVIAFLVAATHFGLSLFWYHGSGPLNPLVSVLVSNDAYETAARYPFEVYGLIALAILLLMAATSHDFWLNNLSAPVWKALHMLVYPAYVLILLHLAFGAMKAEDPGFLPILAATSFGLVAGLHLTTGWIEWRRDGGMRGVKAPDGWIDVCAPEDIPDQRAVIAPLPNGERIAVFREGAKVLAVTNVCRHQNGPLGEGRIIKGCITCPWHGWQYDAETGVSPPPYTEVIETHDVRLSRLGRVFVRIKPNKRGARASYATIRKEGP